MLTLSATFSIFKLRNNKRGNIMGGSSMTRSYFAQKDEERNFNNKKEPEPELVIYKGELVVVEGELK